MNPQKADLQALVHCLSISERVRKANNREREMVEKKPRKPKTGRE